MKRRDFAKGMGLASLVGFMEIVGTVDQKILDLYATTVIHKQKPLDVKNKRIYADISQSAEDLR